jgi:hypothetical protein
MRNEGRACFSGFALQPTDAQYEANNAIHMPRHSCRRTREPRHREDIQNALSTGLGTGPEFIEGANGIRSFGEKLGLVQTLNNLNLKYRKRRRYFCISRNCDGCFLSEFLSGTLLAQKHHNFACLNIGSREKRAPGNGSCFLEWIGLQSHRLPREKCETPRASRENFFAPFDLLRSLRTGHRLSRAFRLRTNDDQYD